MYIINNRNKSPQTGPLDAINSPSYQDLRDALDSGTISKIQNDIFLNPRNKEELYNLKKDPYQYNNLINSNFKNEYHELKEVLQIWTDETGDDLPKSITKDYYSRNQEPHNERSRIKTDFYKTRGTMPGSTNNAVTINKKGPF